MTKIKGQAIVKNENFTIPDTYYYFRKPIMGKWFWKFNRVVDYEYYIRLKRLKTEFSLKDEKWIYTKMLASRKYPIILFQSNDGSFEPVKINRVNGVNTEAMLNTDIWRDFKKALYMKHRLTESRFDKIAKLLTLALFSILGLACVIVVIVLVNKFAIDHTNVLRGFSDNSTWINSTINKVIG